MPASAPASGEEPPTVPVSGPRPDLPPGDRPDVPGRSGVLARLPYPVRLRLKVVLRELATIALLALAYLLAYEIRFEFRVPAGFRSTALTTLPFVVLLKYAVLRAFGVQRQSWRFTSVWDLAALVAALSTSAALLLVLRFLLPPLAAVIDVQIETVLPLGVIAADLAVSIIGLAGLRAIRRMQLEHRAVQRRRSQTTTRPERRVVIIGAGTAGATVARELAARPDLGLVPVGFLDDNPGVHGQRIGGLDVLGGTELLDGLADEQRLDQAIITIAAGRGSALREVVGRCRDAGVEPRIVPGVDELLDGRVELSRLRAVRIEDLLRRAPVELDTSAIAGLVAGASVLVTGAGGSIGAELCRQLARYGPRTLVLAEQAEGALWAIHRELTVVDVGDPAATVAEGVEVVPAIVDVCDAHRVRALLAAHRPSLVFHAAAHKHVPMMEANPGEAVKNNVGGTRTVVDACVEADVDRFVLISTDKAVNPTSVMGATKRIAERYVQHVARTSGRGYVSVRFGNVLGSNGSVVPIFEQQIAAGGPVTVTHPDMRRYFMTIPEACALVIQAAVVGRGGDVLVLDMGEPVRIAELAHDLIELKGLSPGIDIDIVYTGLRAGEKLFEELELDDESIDATTHPSIRITRNHAAGWEQADDDLASLAATVARGDEPALRAAIAALVPEMQAPHGGS